MKTFLLFLLLSCGLVAQTAPWIRIEDDFNDEVSFMHIDQEYAIQLGFDYDADDTIGIVTWTGWADIQHCYFDYYGQPIYSEIENVYAEQLEYQGRTSLFYPPHVAEEHWSIFGWHTMKVSASYRFSTDPPNQPDRILVVNFDVSYPQ